MEDDPQASRPIRGRPSSAGCCRDPAQGVAVARDRRRRAPDQPGDARTRRVRNSQIGEPVPFLGRDVATPRRGVTALRAATETCSKAQWCRASRRKPPPAGSCVPFPARRSMACSRCLTSPPCGFGAKRPVPRRALSHRITDDTDTPKRPSAARRLMPRSTAASARPLKSIAGDPPIPPPRYLPREQRIQTRADLQIPGSELDRKGDAPVQSTRGRHSVSGAGWPTDR